LSRLEIFKLMNTDTTIEYEACQFVIVAFKSQNMKIETIGFSQAR